MVATAQMLRDAPRPAAGDFLAAGAPMCYKRIAGLFRKSSAHRVDGTRNLLHRA
jgi:hypothetical protein